MTTAQALGCLVWHHFDKKPLVGRTRAIVMEQIPPQCRFVDMAESGVLRIETLATISMLWEYLNSQAFKGLYPGPLPQPPEILSDEEQAQRDIEMDTWGDE